ncbi:MAG: hypothetical protein QY305_03130 [Candidatus Brocadiaceae baterium WH-1]|nr:MAG: hypothetical protein QY305_03130 [Candidatus Jettenia sp. AMX2]
MKGDPARSAKPADNFIVIAGCISLGTKMKQKEMDCHSYDKQEGGNPLQKP